MAGGTWGDLSRLGRSAACILFWRGTEEILGVGGFADGSGAARGIPNELFGIAGKLVPTGGDEKGKRIEVDRDCGFIEREGGGGENVSALDVGLRAIMEGIGRVLSRLSGKNGERGTAGCADPAGLRLGAGKHSARNGEQSVAGDGAGCGVPDFGTKPAAGVRVVFWQGFVLDFAGAECSRRFCEFSGGAGVYRQIPAGRRQDSTRNFAGREFRELVQGLSVSVHFGGRYPTLHYCGE